MSSGPKRRSARTLRRAEDRRESALYRRLHARAATLAFEPGELDEEITREPRLLDAVLTGRHAVRRARFRGCRELLPTEGWLVLGLIPAADAVLTKAGAGWSPAPDCWGRTSWPDMLRWGLDKAADTCRLLRVGLTYGAIVLARAQLERWTLNVAFHHQVSPMTDDESAVDYVRRVWSVYPGVAESLDVGLAWTETSEWLHGRGQLTTALSELADAADPRKPGAPAGVPGGMSRLDAGGLPAMLSVHGRVSELAEVVLRQVRGGTTLVAEEHYGDKFTLALQLAHRPDERLAAEPAYLAPLLGALDFEAARGEAGQQAIYWADLYRASVSHPGTAGLLASGTSPGLAAGGMLERRGRAVARSRGAFAVEEEAFGSEFNPGILGARLFRYIAIGEAAFLAAGWASGPEADALRTAAAALHSAWWLWLEDTDDAMPCVRGVLEQACRARAHRVKPARAARVESMGAAGGPVRWLEASGWKRLAVLGRALGEFSHVSFRARWSGARDALTALQASDTPNPGSTARGHALDASAYLLAHEVAARLDQSCPAFAATFRERVTLLDRDEHEQYVEKLLTRALGLRAADFGGPDLHPRPTSA